MMKEGISLFRKIIKVTLWVLLTFVFIFIMIAGLIRMPVIQNRIADYATSSVSSKTNTRVELNNIRISFPESVIIEGVFLEDRQKDTLLYAGEIKVNIALWSLLSKKINIRNLSMTDIRLDVSRSPGDSLYNFHFLVSALNNSTGKKAAGSGSSSGWNFTMDRISLKDLNFHMDDKYNGMKAAVSMESLRLKMDEIDVLNSVYSINELLIDRLMADVMVDSSSNNNVNNTESVLPSIKAKRIRVNNSKLSYGDTIGNQSLVGAAGRLEWDKLTLVASDLYYSPDTASFSIREFTATDKNGFIVSKFETDFIMDQNSITANNLNVRAGNSSVIADLKFEYDSFESLMDSVASLSLALDIEKLSLQNSDILYFYPRLIENPLFRDKPAFITFSGSVNGKIGDLKGNNIRVTAGRETTLETGFRITGLPDPATARYSFPDLDITTGRQDIRLIAGKYITDSIILPSRINSHIVFEGMMKAFESSVSLKSSFGAMQLYATVDEYENFRGRVLLDNFDMGRLLNDTAMYGPLTLTAEASGTGLDKENIRAKLKAEAGQIYFNSYTYHKLNLEGDINGREFEGKVSVDDMNAAFDLDALVNLNPGREHYIFKLDMHRADLQKLNLTGNEIRLGFFMEADIKGRSLNKINGGADIVNITVGTSEEEYLLDKLLLSFSNDADRNEFSIASPLVDLKYEGTVPPLDLPAVLAGHINNYFSLADSILNDEKSPAGRFSFDIQLHKHPVVTEAFFPGLEDYSSGEISGSFDAKESLMEFKARMQGIKFGNVELEDIAVDIASDINAINYSISCGNASTSALKIDNFLVDGKLADNVIFSRISSVDDDQNRKFMVRSQLTREEAAFRLSIDPDGLYLMNEPWELAQDNYIKFGKEGFIIHNLVISTAERRLAIASVEDVYNSDLDITINNFSLDAISGIVEKEAGLVMGIVNGNVRLKRVNSSYLIVGDAMIKDLFVLDQLIGDMSVKAENPVTDIFNIDMKITGKENNITATGYFNTGGERSTMNIDVSIQSLFLETIKTFSMGNVKEASGKIAGDLLINGYTDEPGVTGRLMFSDVFITPAAINNRLELPDETVIFKNDGIYFNSFRILDPEKNVAIIDGVIGMDRFRDFDLSLKAGMQNFLLFNTTEKDNDEFFGRMQIDSQIDIQGPLEHPQVNARLKLKEGSNFTFAVSDKELSADRGDNIVSFNSTAESKPVPDTSDSDLDPVLEGFTISSIIEIDKQATLRLLLDPSTNESLVVKGDAALSFSLDRSGKMSLTGMYVISEGSYNVSLESLVNRKFEIESGSQITWNGDPMDAELSVNAIYTVRAAPFDLVAGQIAGFNEEDRNKYKQQYPFMVILRLRGPVMHPDISFEIQLTPENKGIFGGAVNAKLNMLNEDPSALNKQVFALLVLGRFVQENPFQTGTGVVSSTVRTTAGKMLSSQLNQWSSEMIPGVDMNFDIQSYNDYESGTAVGRTQIDVGVKKQLFNERLSVQVGGTVDVEGEQAKQNSAKNITGDVLIEYDLTKDGSLRLKGFRHNQYEGAIEGQLTETGAGIIYVLDFDKWKELFKSKSERIDSLKKNEQK